MARRLDELAAEALELTRDARAALAKRLLESLDEPSVEALGEGWTAEADRRLAALRSGNARSVSSEEVFSKLESRNRK